MFGPHLIIDASKCNTAKLGDRLLIERLLTQYPQAIGMTRIGGPYMFEYQAPDPAYSGVSGLVVIAESHIAIHTFPALDYFTMDIFSCKNFDHEAAIAYIRDALEVQEMDRMLVQRGLSFRGPHHGPLGATDELIAAASERHQSLGLTIGSIPVGDPLYPRPADVGQMLWPAYGVSPDIGSQSVVSGGAREGAVVLPANAAAAGMQGRTGLVPIQPAQLNPTASTSGLLDRMASLGGQSRKLGKALDRWEQAARRGTPIALAIGPQVIAEGMRDLVADLIQRGHVAAIILEGEALLADAYESLGYRHYLPVESEDGVPLRPPDEQDGALAQIATFLAAADGGEPVTCLAQALHLHAPRPGILTAALAAGIPILIAGTTALEALGLTATVTLPDLSGIAIIAFSTGQDIAILAAQSAGVLIAADAAMESAEVVVPVASSIALPLLATAIVQRLPHRAARPSPAPERELLTVG